MDLVQEAAARLRLDPDTTAAALGNLLFGMRMGLDGRTWDEMRRAVPDVAALLAKVPRGGGRTAEMVSLTAPGAVRKTLEALGLTGAQVDALADTGRAALRTQLSAEAAERALGSLDRAVTAEP